MDPAFRAGALNVAALVFVFCLGRAARGSDQEGTKITDLFVDVAQIHHDAKSNGDTWDYIPRT